MDNKTTVVGYIIRDNEKVKLTELSSAELTRLIQTLNKSAMETAGFVQVAKLAKCR